MNEQTEPQLTPEGQERVVLSHPFARDPSPLYYANLCASETVVINQGGTSCFAPDTLVETSEGYVPISQVRIGSHVRAYNFDTGKPEYCCVLDRFEYDNHKPTIKVYLKDGSHIVATEDHKIYCEGGWLTLKDIVSLYDGRNMVTDTGL